MYKGDMDSYFRLIEDSFNRLLEIANKARSKGIDPEPYVEVKSARDLAERVEGLLGIRGIAEIIRELLKSMSKERAAFELSKALIYRLEDLSDERKAEISIRAGLAVLTDGVTAAPIQGIDCIKFKRNPDGSLYLAIYYAGPIRSAGGTEQALSVLLADYVRRLLKLSEYKPTKEEVERYLEELRLYERRVARFQYHASDEEIRLVVSHLPVEVTGVPTDLVEVSIHRDLPRVETNRVRGGALRVINDGIIAKARKLIPLVEELRIEGWDWLHKLIKDRNKKEGGTVEPSEKYLEDVVAGRPIFSHPSRKGGFRIRYGRARNTGLAAIGMNPATMVILGEFLAIGTQVRTERPGKSAIVMPVDSIEGPIVKLRDGSVLQVQDMEEAVRIKDQVEEVIFAGDILVAYGEFKENNYPLVPSGYCEEWWAQDLRKKIEDIEVNHIKALGLDPARLRRMIDEPLRIRPTPEEALLLAEKLKVPLHPKYTYLWNNVRVEDVKLLMKELAIKSKVLKKEGRVRAIRVKSMRPEAKRVLELLGVPHRVVDDEVLIEEHAPIVYKLFFHKADIPSWYYHDVREYIECISGIPLRNKVIMYTGLRMGRPEKASPRRMSPPVHALFPLGETGGRKRSLSEAAKGGTIRVEVVNRICPICRRRTFDYSCPLCGQRTKIIRRCPRCGRELDKARCPSCGMNTIAFTTMNINIESYVSTLVRKFNIKVPKDVKCVKGLMSEDKEPEPLVKGILRAIHDVYVFKDGTIRFDATNAPITHFKPKEIGTSVDKLRKLGYDKDYKGRPLVDDEQIVELKVQDVILPRKAGEYLVRVAKFVDELLEKVYGMEPFYKVEKLEDLIGHLVIGLAPHTSVGIVGRIIGFTDANVIFAHPYWHAAKRRNCDGDEDSVMLALDVLLNFSRHYLPKHRGGLMDAPLVVTVIVNPKEVDDEVYNMDVVWQYPSEFYEHTLGMPMPSDLKRMIETVEDRVYGTKSPFMNLGFTHFTSSIVMGPKDTAYRSLKTMSEKVRAQLKIAKMMLAVDEDDVAERLLVHHFIPDLMGNLRVFASQKFRCSSCNAIYRRPPLGGRCPRCGGKIVLTVHEGTVKKYLEFARSIVETYKVKDYVRQRFALLELMLKVTFRREAYHLDLEKFMREST